MRAPLPLPHPRMLLLPHPRTKRPSRGPKRKPATQRDMSSTSTHSHPAHTHPHPVHAHSHHTHTLLTPCSHPAHTHPHPFTPFPQPSTLLIAGARTADAQRRPSTTTREPTWQRHMAATSTGILFYIHIVYYIVNTILFTWPSPTAARAPVL